MTKKKSSSKSTNKATDKLLSKSAVETLGKTTSESPQLNGQKKVALPLFYKSITPLRKDIHSELSLSIKSNYSFSKNSNAVPLVITEFSAAQRNYPIFFSNTNNNLPLAALGPNTMDTNLFVDNKGDWKENHYIPIYIRRYPFFALSRPNQNKPNEENSNSKSNDKDTNPHEQTLILAVDQESPLFKAKGDIHNIFKGNEGQRIVDNALIICKSFAQAGKVTEEFVREIKRLDLLDWQTLTKTVNKNPTGTGNDEDQPINFAKDKGEEQLFSFLAVNPEKLIKIDDKEILELNKKGFLAAIYAHLFSLQNWQAIIRATLIDEASNSRKK